MDDIKKSGKTELITPTAAESAAMRKAMEPLFQEMAGRVGKQLIDDVVKADVRCHELTINSGPRPFHRGPFVSRGGDSKASIDVGRVPRYGFRRRFGVARRGH